VVDNWWMVMMVVICSNNSWWLVMMMVIISNNSWWVVMMDSAWIESSVMSIIINWTR
jgi:hypothetical protein